LLFHVFASEEERRRYGGTAFVEIQYCDMPSRTFAGRLPAARHIQSWKNDSLYVHADDLDTFCREYGSLPGRDSCNGRKCRSIDPYGINYFAAAAVDLLIAWLDKEKPADYEVLAAWLASAKERNGFYILGL